MQTSSPAPISLLAVSASMSGLFGMTSSRTDALGTQDWLTLEMLHKTAYFLASRLEKQFAQNFRTMLEDSVCAPSLC